MSKKDIFNQLKFSISEASKKEKCSKLYLWLSFIYNFIFESFTPKQFISLKIYKYKHIEKRKYINHRRAEKIDKCFNDNSIRKYFDDKCLFNSTFFENVKRKWINLKDCDDKCVIDFFNLYHEAIVKPNDLSGGRGIFKASNFDDVKSFIGKNYLLEEVVVNHSEIKKFCPNVCNTIRVYTFIDKNGDVNFLAAYLRIGSGKGVTDNMHSGGGAVPIDWDTGVIIGPKKDYYGNEEHINPYTNNIYIGERIPLWNLVKNAIYNAATKFKKARYIAWDVAVTNNNQIEFIEGNVRPDPNLLQMSFGPQFYKFKGELKK